MNNITAPSSTITLTVPGDITGNILASGNHVTLAKEFIVDSQEMMEAASLELKSVKAFHKQLEDKQKELTKPLNDLKQKWVDFFRPALDSLKEAEGIYKSSINNYLTEQERIRVAKQRELEQAAAKERARLEDEAKKLRESGKQEEANNLEAVRSLVTPSVVPITTKSVAGISQAETWKAEVVDKAAFIKAVAEGLVSPDLVEINMPSLNKMAVALKDSLNIPGVKAVSSKTIRARA